MEREKMIEEMAKDIARIKFCLLRKDDDREFAVSLINKGYRKIPEGSVVFTKEEYDEIKSALEVSHAYMVKEAYRIEQVRKETAKEILRKSNEINKGGQNDLCELEVWIQEYYGVEVEE